MDSRGRGLAVPVQPCGQQLHGDAEPVRITLRVVARLAQRVTIPGIAWPPRRLRVNTVLAQSSGWPRTRLAVGL